MSILDDCLNDLQRRIDENQEAQCRRAWVEFLDGRCPTEEFFPPERPPSPPGVAWPRPRVNQTLDDFDAMLMQQFRGVSDVLENGWRGVLSVRSNYGTGILPTLFGCELFLMEDQQDTLPAARPLGSADAVRRLLDRGVPNLDAGLGARTFECGRRLRDTLARFPVLERWVSLYHPDVQGPIDVAEVVWGSDIFYAFYEDPALLKDFLSLVTDTYIAFMRRWHEMVPQRTPYAVHWGLMHKGTIMLRNDSLMNLSPQAYVEFVRPMDERCFDAFGGGAIHFCGRCEHYIEPMSECRGLTAVNLGQPYMNDPETICRHTVDKGIQIVGLFGNFPRRDGGTLRGLAHRQG